VKQDSVGGVGAVTMFVLVALSGVVLPLSAGVIRNFRNDPTLAKAFRYDLSMLEDKSQADHELAERHYLAYLERETESWQRARVYVQLGVLFAVGYDVSVGESPDYERACRYFEKALQEEPNRIGWETLQARTMLASMHESREDRLRADMAVYAFLHTLDERALRERWLPATPEELEQGPPDRQVEWMLNTVESLKSTTAYNMVALAGSRLTPNREQWLRELIERFPGTEAADLAQKALAKPDSLVQPPVQEPPAAPLAPGPPVKRLGASRLIAEPNGLALSGKPITLLAAPRQPSQEPVPLATAKPASGRRFPWWLPALGVAALILAAGGYYKWGS